LYTREELPRKVEGSNLEERECRRAQTYKEGKNPRENSEVLIRGKTGTTQKAGENGQRKNERSSKKEGV